MSTTEQQPPDPAIDRSCARALCGWSPPSLPADTALKRRVDRLRIGNLASVGIVVLVVGLLSLAPHLPYRASLATDGLAGLAGGGWCLLNFWRCRHAHCLVTGPGWLAFGAFALSEAVLGRSLVAGNEQPLFLAVLVTAVAFEVAWYLVCRTNALRVADSSA